MKKIFSIFAISCVALLTTFSCTKVDVYEDTTNPLPATAVAEDVLQGLEITPKTSYVVVGEPVALTVAAVPENAVVDGVKWTSSDESVAKVDGEGNVTTLAKGVARITVTAGTQSATALVNVFAERVPATEIKLNKTEVNLLVGRATKVKATLLPDGTGEDGIATTDQPAFEWSSSNTGVVTVSYGFIQAVGKGEATVTVKQGNLSASAKVTVADKIKLVDRSQAWVVSDTPKWKKDWYGRITGSEEEVKVEGFDQEYAYFQVVSADKFTDVETIANTVYEQVEERKDAGQSPKSLFGTGETQTRTYGDMGEAVAYVLGYDGEFEFTGEYVVYRFTAREPDPVHATGIQFTQGWNNTPIESINLKPGKSLNYFSAKLLPDDCTDTGDITFTSSDETVVTLKPYYSSYYTVTAVASGKASIIAKFGDLEASIPVTVEGGELVWTDCSKVWKGSFGEVDYWGSKYFGFTLKECTSPMHYMFMAKASEVGSDLVGYMKSEAAANEEWLSYYANSELPDQVVNYYGGADDEYYAFVVGVDAAGSAFDGRYAIFHYVPGQVEPVPAKVVDMKTAFFDYTWPSDLATLDEVTMETWVNTAGNPGKNESIIGVEGVFLLRTEDSQWQLICGGDKKANGEYSEIKLATGWTVNEWTHLAAVYSRSEGKAYLYVNGEQKVVKDIKDHGVDMNGVGAQWQLPFSFIIGNACDGNRYVQGTIAYTRVWSSARSASDIKAGMYKADVSGSNLIASWYFNEGEGDTIADHSGNGRTLTGKKFESQMNYPATTLNWIDGTLPY